jgi:hypothetical protein
LIRAVVLTCLAAGLPACANQTAYDREIERALAPHHSSCLAMGQPAHTQGHTDCVVERYAGRQRELERLRAAVDPPVYPPDFELPQD